MLHLAIECSALAGSVALLRGQTVIAERHLPANVGSVQSLAPAIVELLTQHGSGGSLPLGLISVTQGPGSFTGLRAGLATAKMLGLAWNIPLVAVDTLHVIAARACQEAAQRHREVVEERGPEAGQAVVVAVLNAFRKQVFAAAWSISTGGSEEPGLAMLPVASAQVLDAARWQAQPLSSLTACLRELNPQNSPSFSSAAIAQPLAPALTHEENPLGAKRIWVSGPGLRSYLPPTDSCVDLIDPSNWDPVAGWVGRLGWQSYLAGQAVSAAELSPNYVRSSAAEESRNSAGA